MIKYSIPFAEVRHGKSTYKSIVGRRSRCVGDDIKVLNLASLYLSDNLNEFVLRLNKIRHLMNRRAT